MTRHSCQQKRVMKRFDSLLESVEAFQEWPIATGGGAKQADVIWASDTRLGEMEETGEPPTLAPEICAKRDLYLETSAEDVRDATNEGRGWFFAGEELEGSDIALGFPSEP